MERTLSRSGVAVLLVACGVLLSGCGQQAKDAILKKFITPLAIEQMTNMKGDIGWYADQYCHDKDLKYEDMAESIWWPGCPGGANSTWSDKCKGTCATKDKVEAVSAFNKKHGGKKVTYKSRKGKTEGGKDIEVLDLTGWWLPAPGATKDTPRIVLQHGFISNSNKFREVYTAYLLRKAGYSVLVNNFRDHCYSEDSKKDGGVVSWGEAYPLDLLGAWDYLVKDAEPGPIDASKVGIMGASMGAFTTLNSFGLEGDVPAAWVDAPPWTPMAGFSRGLYLHLKNKMPADVSWLHSHIIEDVWKQVVEDAKKKGVDLNAHLPEKELPKGPDTKRPIFVTANKDDAAVSYENSQKLVDFLKKYKDKYELEKFWLVEGETSCDGETHCTDMVLHDDEYEKYIKQFWGGVFGQKQQEEKKGDSGDNDKKKEKLFATGQVGITATHFSPFMLAAFLAVAAIGLAAVAARAAFSRRNLALAESVELVDALE